MKTIRFKILAVLVILGSGALASSSHAGDNLPICFIVGAGGGSQWTLEGFIPEMKSRGIEWIPFTPGNKGTVIERANLVAKLFQNKLDKTPNFKCHIFAYSMGGPVVRYLYHHIPLKVRGEKVHASSVFKSITTFSSPHLGTPLARWLRKYAPSYSRGVEDLSEEAMVKFNSPEFPETFSPLPEEIPSFSYLTFIEHQDEANTFLMKAGFQLIEQINTARDWDTRNDGIIPLSSQPFGEPLAAVQADHEYFSIDLGLRPWAPDIYEIQWKFLEGNLAGSPVFGDTANSELVHFADSPLTAMF